MAEDRQNESIYDPKLSDMEVEAGYQRWLERMDDPQYKEEVVAEYRRRRKDDTRSDEEILAVYRRFSDPGPFIGEKVQCQRQSDSWERLCSVYTGEAPCISSACHRH